MFDEFIYVTVTFLNFLSMVEVIDSVENFMCAFYSCYRNRLDITKHGDLKAYFHRALLKNTYI